MEGGREGGREREGWTEGGRGRKWDGWREGEGGREGGRGRKREREGVGEGSATYIYTNRAVSIHDNNPRIGHPKLYMGCPILGLREIVVTSNGRRVVMEVYIIIYTVLQEQYVC